MALPNTNHLTETVQRSLSRNVSIAIVARVGYLASRLFIPPFVLTRVGLEAYGLWSAAFVLVSYLGISTFGISNVYIKYVAGYLAAEDYRRANSLLSTGFLVTSGVCLALFAGLCLEWSWILTWIDIPPYLMNDAREVVFSIVTIFLLSLACSVFSDALIGAQQLATVQKIWTVAYLVETVLIFTFVGLGRGISGMAEAFVIRTIIEIGLSAFVAFRRLSWLRISPALCSREALRKLVSFGGVVQLLGLIAIVLSSVERTLAVSLAGLRAAGVIELSKKFPSMASLVPNAFLSSFVPAAAYLQSGLTENAEEARREIKRLYLKGGRYMNLSTALVTGVLVAAPAAILRCWLGKNNPGAALLLVVFSVSTQVHLLTGPGTAILKGLGRPLEEFFYAIPNILFLVVTVPLSFFVLGRWSVKAIGVAVAVSTIAAAGLFIWRANRLLHVSLREYLVEVVLPGVTPYVVAFAVVSPFSTVVLTSYRPVAAVILGAVGCLYGVVLSSVVYRYVFSCEEQQWVLALLRQRFGVFFPNRRTVAA
jgi:O-antigen/teichoic acid export membrane protein